MRRGSVSPASSRARSDGSIPVRSTTRPSTFETAFCATTSTSSCSKPARARGGIGEQRTEIVSLLELRESRGAGRRAARRSTEARDPDPGVALVPLVHVDDDGRQALERAGARERAGVERASGREPRGELERGCLRVGVVAADEGVLVGRAIGPEARRGERVEPRDDRARPPRPGFARRARRLPRWERRRPSRS